MGACKVCGKMGCYAHGGKAKMMPKPKRSADELMDAQDKGFENTKMEASKSFGHFGKDKEEMAHQGLEKLYAKHKLGPEQLEKREGTPLQMKKFADGGKVDEIDVGLDDDMDMDDVDSELNDMAAQELMDALEKKDKKAVLESIKALVMNCGGKI